VKFVSVHWDIGVGLGLDMVGGVTYGLGLVTIA